MSEAPRQAQTRAGMTDVCSGGYEDRLGPALGEQDLRIPDGKSQTAGLTQLWTRPSIRCVPQVHGPMKLVKRHRRTEVGASILVVITSRGSVAYPHSFR